MSYKILTVVGARPQFIKAATISRAIKTFPSLNEVMVHTGQHYDADMSDTFFDELEIPTPKYNLAIHGGSHGEMTGRMLEQIEKLIVSEAPDLILIYGDTNSTLAGALAPAKLSIPVAHVEAGLRSFNRDMPEEINRVVADHLSQLLFCPTKTAVQNLETEGITKNVFNVGDVMYDSALFAGEKAKVKSDILHRLNLSERDYAIATIHRAENTNQKQKLSDVLEWLKEKAQNFPVVLPLHPRTKKAAERFELNFDGLTVCTPLSYFDMTQLLTQCIEVYCDSGGVQKEAYFHGKPCVTLRNETEWVETVENGWNRLWKDEDYKPRKIFDEYGNGNSAQLILEEIELYLQNNKVE